MAPNAETEDINTMTSDFSKIHNLEAAIFHTMAFKLSLEIIKNKVTPKSLIAFLKVLYNVTQIKKKQITFDQYSRIHLDGLKIAISETASNVVCVLNSSFTTKDHNFHTALQEATLDINKNWKNLTRFNIKLIHRNNIFYCHKQHTYNLSLLKIHLSTSSSFFDDASRCSCRSSSKELLLQR